MIQFNNVIKFCLCVFFFSSLLLKSNAQNSNLAMYDPNPADKFYLSTGINYHLPFFMKDMGPQFSHAVKYSYSVNGGVAVNQAGSVDHNNTDNCVNAIGLSGYRIAFTTPVNFATAGTYKIKVWIDSIDGYADINHSNDTLVRTYKVMNNVPVRKGLNEYSYHVSCGPCGEHGTSFNEFLLDNYDDYMVGVKLHVENVSGPWSFLNCPEAHEIDSAIDGITHPQMTYNRSILLPYENGMTYYPYPGFCPTDSNYIIRDINFFNKVPVEFSFSNVSLNNVTNEFLFKLNTKFIDSMTFPKETRISCMLVEDSIWYYQASNGTHPVDSEYHRFVLRKIYGGPWGKPASLPASVSINQTVGLSFADTLKATYNKSRLYLIPVIQSYTSSYDTREILNTRRFKLNQLTAPNGLNEIKSCNGLQLYPNPSNGLTCLEANEGSIRSYSIYTIEGKLVYRSDLRYQLNVKKAQINTAQLEHGTYFIKAIMSDGREATIKLLVQ